MKMKLLLAIAALAIGALLAIAPQAQAVTRDPVADAVAVKPVAGSLPFPVASGATVSVLEAPACGSSPCAVTAASTLILGVNTARHAMRIRNVGTVDLFCCLGSTCTSTAYAFFLATATKDTLDLQSLTLWGGAVSCAGSAGGSLAVSAY